MRAAVDAIGDEPPDEGGGRSNLSVQVSSSPASLAAAALLRARTARFFAVALDAHPRAALETLRGADAWRVLLDSDVPHGPLPAGSPSRWSASFGTAELAAAAWLEGARAAAEIFSGSRAVFGGSNADAAHAARGAEAEIRAALDAAWRRASQPRAVVTLVSALARLRDANPRAVPAPFAEAEAPAKLAETARRSLAFDEDDEDENENRERSGGPDDPAGPEPDRAAAGPSPSGRDARRVALALLVSSLEDGGAALAAKALASPATAEALFALVDAREGGATRALAVRCLGRLFTAAPASPERDALVDRFLQALPSAPPERSRDMLAGLRDALDGPGGGRLRECFAADGGGRAYVQVTSLLTADAGRRSFSRVPEENERERERERESERAGVALDALRTLRSLLSGSETAYAAFGRDVGYDVLAAATEAARGGRPPPEALVRAVFELAADEDLSAASERGEGNEEGNEEGDEGGFLVGSNERVVALANPGPLPALAALLRAAEPPVQARGLRALFLALDASVASRETAERADLLGHLLDWFGDAARAEEALRREGEKEGKGIPSGGDASDEASDAGGRSSGTGLRTPPSSGPGFDALASLAACAGRCASHSLSARRFRGAIRTVLDPRVGVRGRRLLLGALREAATRDGPAAYFDFAGPRTPHSPTPRNPRTLRNPSGGSSSASDGPGSLALRRVPFAFPAGRGGYAFAAWLRVEAFPREGAGRAALFALRATDGQGVAAELGPGGVELSVFSGASQSGQGGGGHAACSEVASLDAPIREKRWTHVAVTHQAGRPPLAAATAKLFVDGELVASRKLRFPRVAEPLTASRVGAFDDFDAAAAAAAKANAKAIGRRDKASASGASASATGALALDRAAPFEGQMGAIRFFDDAPGASAVSAMAALGPEYLGSFSPSETAAGLALAGAGMSPGEAREAREALAARLALSLDAAASSGRDCYSVVGDAGGGLLAFLGSVRDAVAGIAIEGIEGGIAGGERGFHGGDKISSRSLPGAVAGAVAGAVGSLGGAVRRAADDAARTTRRGAGAAGARGAGAAPTRGVPTWIRPPGGVPSPRRSSGPRACARRGARWTSCTASAAPSRCSRSSRRRRTATTPPPREGSHNAPLLPPPKKPPPPPPRGLSRKARGRWPRTPRGSSRRSSRVRA